MSSKGPKGPTETVPPDQRGGTYERDSTTRAVLLYGGHTIHELRRDRKITTFGSDDDRDIQIISEHISGRHGRLENRARGIVLIDEHSKNGTFCETRRAFGLGLRALLDYLPVPADGAPLRPGTTFVIGKRGQRYIAIDNEIRKHHPALLDLLGTEDEVNDDVQGKDGSPGMPELVSPSDFILAADTVGHLLITGHPNTAPDELARIAHKISKRRGGKLVERDRLPDDPKEQRALVIDEANDETLLLNFLGIDVKRPPPLDPRLVESLFSPSYQIRVIVLTRTVEVARALFGDAYLQTMMRIPLRPLDERRAAIGPTFDRWFALHDSPLRLADLTPENRRRILMHDWRTHDTLHQAARRLDAIVRAPTLNQARQSMRIAPSSFYAWFQSLGLGDPLVSPERTPVLRAALAAQSPLADEGPDVERADDSSDDEK